MLVHALEDGVLVLQVSKMYELAIGPYPYIKESPKDRVVLGNKRNQFMHVALQ